MEAREAEEEEHLFGRPFSVGGREGQQKHGMRDTTPRTGGSASSLIGEHFSQKQISQKGGENGGGVTFLTANFRD